MHVLSLGEVLRGTPVYSLHVVDAGGSWSYPEHTHRGFGDLLVLERGVMRQQINGLPIELQAGEAILVRPADRHALQGTGLRFHNINLPEAEWRRLADYAGGAWWTAMSAAPVAPRARFGAADRRWIHSDLSELIAGQGGGSARSLLARFLLRWLPLFSPDRGARPVEPAWLAPLQRQIGDRIAHGLEVVDLPRLAGVSQAHVSRSFRRHLGVTPSQYVNQVRVQRAAHLLATTGRDILDIGFSLGFRSPSYFYRVFARACGLPPAAFRRRHRMP